MAWIYLVFAGLLEIVWAFFMKKSAGFTLPVPSAITLVTMTASFILLSVAMKSLPLGIAYMIWTGIGAVGAFVVRSEEHTSELQSLMRISYAVFCLKKKTCKHNNSTSRQ